MVWPPLLQLRNSSLWPISCQKPPTPVPLTLTWDRPTNLPVLGCMVLVQGPGQSWKGWLIPHPWGHPWHLSWSHLTHMALLAPQLSPCQLCMFSVSQLEKIYQAQAPPVHHISDSHLSGNQGHRYPPAVHWLLSLIKSELLWIRFSMCPTVQPSPWNRKLTCLVTIWLSVGPSPMLWLGMWQFIQMNRCLMVDRCLILQSFQKDSLHRKKKPHPSPKRHCTPEHSYKLLLIQTSIQTVAQLNKSSRSSVQEQGDEWGTTRGCPAAQPGLVKKGYWI